MKNLMKRGFALLMAFVMVLGLLPAMSFAVAAESSIVDYQYAYVSDTYPSVIKNWGTRGELATFLSPNAEAFYEGTSLETLSALAGSADTATVHESALYVELQKLMADAHKTTTSYDATRDMFQYTDSQKNGTETTAISAFYSGTLIGPAWDGKTWNREHTWPNSKGGEGDGTHENDIMMLRPEAGNVNSSRSNRAYGISDGYFNPNTGDYNLHGDVARIMLYTFVRWGGVTETADDGTVTYTILDNMWGEAGVIESLDVLLDWAEEDPVDTWELARNDSVQSITGTRNVFVDYPELVFELFEVEIPAGYDTPSGSVNNVDFTITPVVTNPEGGEVTVNGEYVTVHPYAGYQLSSIAFSEGTTHTQNFNVFPVTSTNDCTVTVSFAKLDKFTVKVMENGKEVATAEVYDGNIYKLPEFSGTLPEGYTFYGWATYEAADSSTKPSVISKAGEEMTIDDNIVYYAVLSYLNTGVKDETALTYELVDSAEDLVIGSSYVITAATTDKALSTTQNGNNRGSADITKSNNVLMFTDDAGVAELVLGEGVPVTEPPATEPPATEPPASEPDASNPGDTTDGYVYKKVTSAPADWSGEYLIVYEAGSLVFDGSRTTLDAADNGKTVTITDDTIEYESNKGYAFTIAPVTGGYSIKSASNYYIGRDTNKNGMLSNTKTQYVNTITLVDGGAHIVGTQGAVLRFNSGTNSGMRFRYYTSSTYNNQNAIHLYVKTPVAATAEVKATKAGTSATSTYTFYDATEANAGYLYAASSSNNYLRTQTAVDGNASWTITVNGDGSCTLIATGANTHNNLQYNTQNNIFSCYSTTQVPVALYVGVPGVGTMYYTSTWTDWETPIDPTEEPTEAPTEVPSEEPTEEPSEEPTEAPEVPSEPVSDGYQLITLDSVSAGNYVIGAVRDGAYPNVYLATNKISKDWTVSDTVVTATNGIIAKDALPADAQVLVFEGDNTNGFTIGFNNGTKMVYLGYTDILTTRTLAVGANYSNIKWTVVADSEGGFALVSTDGTNKYAISQNSTAATAIRGYKNGAVYDGIYLFAAAASDEPVEPSIPEPSEPETTVPYVTSPEVETAYHLAVNQVNLGKTLYFNGAMDGYYLATSEIAAEAVEVYLEEAEGGYRLYFMNGETKTYIRCYERGATSGGVEQVTTAPAEISTWNATYNTLFVAGSQNSFYLGTRGSYDTISGNSSNFMTESNVDVSQFPARLYPIPTEEVVVTAQDGVNKLIDQTGAIYNGYELPGSIVVGDVTMNIAWTVETSDANAAKIENGVLVLTPQTAAATYTLTATVSNGADDTAATSWSGNVVPTSSEFENGTYVIWTADGNAVTTISSGYGYFAPTNGVALTDGVLSGYVNDNLFTFTANGDGTYSIVDYNGNYVYSDMSYASSKQFNVSATKPAAGADWTVVANGDGTYSIYNVNRAGAVNYSSYSNFELNTSSATALFLTAAETIAEDPNTLTYVFSGFIAGEQYAENEEHVLDDVVTVIVDKGHFTSELRLYNSESNDSTAIIKSARDINKIVLKAGYKTGDLAVYASDYGYNWVLIDTVSVASATYTNYTVTIPEDTVYGYIKLDSISDGVQIRVSEMAVTMGDEIPACKHGEIADDAAVAPSLSATGLTAGSHCAICGEVIVAQDVIPCLASVDSWSLTLSDDLAVNFRFAISTTIESTAQVSITVADGEPVIYTMQDCFYDISSEDGTVAYYMASVHVAATQMQDEIKVQIRNGDDATEVKTYTVESYAKTVLADETMRQYHQVVKDMLNYGAAAQVYFQHNHEGTLPNADITGFGNEEIPAEPVTKQIATGAVDGISFYAASLVHKERIAVRLYFKLLSGSISDYIFTDMLADVEGNPGNMLTPVCKDEQEGLYYIEFADINPGWLNRPVFLYVLKGDQHIDVQYSPLDYIIRMNNKETSSDALKTMLKALYNYYLSADDIAGDSI